jgi:cell wall-associated NlpC family hydrolase
MTKKQCKHTKFAVILIAAVIITACKREKIDMKINTDDTYIEMTTAAPVSTEKSTSSAVPGTLTAEKSDVSEQSDILTVGSSSPETSANPRGTDDTTIVMSGASDNDITSTAKTLLGIPFTEGGDNPAAGFDNSGFIYYVLKQNGYAGCPRGVREQSEMGTNVSSLSDLLPGDLVFFSDSGTTPQYGGIYIGDGTMIYAPQPTQNVKEVKISSGYYAAHFLKGVRVI